jgi:hypothetical protein
MCRRPRQRPHPPRRDLRREDRPCSSRSASGSWSANERSRPRGLASLPRRQLRPRRPLPRHEWHRAAPPPVPRQVEARPRHRLRPRRCCVVRRRPSPRRFRPPRGRRRR